MSARIGLIVLTGAILVAMITGAAVIPAQMPGGVSAPPLKAAPLDFLTSFAALATAVALAYAALPSFRHRIRVQDYVCRALEKAMLVPLLASDKNTGGIACGHDSWAILFRLGKLERESKYPCPGIVGQNARDAAEIDRNFTHRPEFKAYKWLYASNLDKIISVMLGAISASVIWVATIDHVQYVEPLVNDPDRDKFLCSCITFYSICLLIMLISPIFHKIFYTDSDETDRRFGLVYVIKWIVVILFFASLAGLSLGWLPAASDFINIIPEQTESLTLIAIEVALVAAVIIPLLLHWRGEILTAEMLSETDQCIRTLSGVLKTVPATASLDDQGDDDLFRQAGTSVHSFRGTNNE